MLTMAKIFAELFAPILNEIAGWYCRFERWVEQSVTVMQINVTKK